MTTKNACLGVFQERNFTKNKIIHIVESLRPTLNDTNFTKNSEGQYVKEKDLGFLTTASTLGRHIGNCRTFFGKSSADVSVLNI